MNDKPQPWSALNTGGFYRFFDWIGRHDKLVLRLGVAAALLFGVYMAIQAPNAIAAVAVIVGFVIWGIVWLVRSCREQHQRDRICEQSRSYVLEALGRFLSDLTYEPMASLTKEYTSPLFGRFAYVSGSDLVRGCVQGREIMACDMVIEKRGPKDRMKTVHDGCVLALKTDVKPEHFIGVYAWEGKEKLLYISLCRKKPSMDLAQLLPQDLLTRLYRTACAEFRIGFTPDGWLLLAVDNRRRMFTYDPEMNTPELLRRGAENDVNRLHNIISVLLTHPILNDPAEGDASV